MSFQSPKSPTSSSSLKRSDSTISLDKVIIFIRNDLDSYQNSGYLPNN